MGRQQQQPVFGQTMQELFDDCKRGQTQRVQSWIAQKGKKQRSPLSFLRSNGPSVPASGWLCGLRQPSTSHTLLHLASLHGHGDLARLLVQRDEQLVRARDRKGCLPLHLAAWNGHLALLEILLDSDPECKNAVDNAKQTALHLATLNGHGQAVRLLLQRHVDGLLRNAHQESALDIAVRTGKANICRLLLLHCPDLPLQCASDCCPSSPLTMMPVPSYPLHIAARLGHEDCLHALLEHGFDVNYLEREGTPLHVAAKQGHAMVARILLDKGAISGIRDGEGRTAMEWLEDRLKSGERRGEAMISKWKECREILTVDGREMGMEGRQKNGQKGEAEEEEGNWKSLNPKQRRGGGGGSLQRKMPPIPSPRSAINPIAVENGEKTFQRARTASPHQGPISPAPSSTPSPCCAYQPLPEEICQQNGGKPMSPPMNYQNVPNGGLLYDNAPIGSSARKKWEHNCAGGRGMSPMDGQTSPGGEGGGTLIRPTTTTTASTFIVNSSNRRQSPPKNGHFPVVPAHKSPPKMDEFEQLRMPSAEFLGMDSDCYSPCSTLGRTTASPPVSPWNGHNMKRDGAPLARPEDLTTSACTTEPNSPERVISRDSSSSEPRTLHHSSDQIQSLPVPSCNSIATLALSPASSSSSSSTSFPMISHFSPALSPPVSSPTNQLLPSFPAKLPPSSLSANATTTGCPMVGPFHRSRPKVLQPNQHSSSSEAAITARPHQLMKQGGGDKDGMIEWKDIDDLLSTFQRESFYSPVQKQIVPPARRQQLADEVAPKCATALLSHSPNGHPASSPTSCSALLIVIWLKEEVGLDVEMANWIGPLLYKNGFELVEFMKGTLNTKLMGEMGIERKSQLRICRHLNEPGLPECIPDAAKFEFVSDWLNSLHLLDHLGSFSRANLTSSADLVVANLSRGDLEKMGITQLGHIARIIRSLDMAIKGQKRLTNQKNKQTESQSLSTINSSSPREYRDNSISAESKASSTASSSRAASLSPQMDIAELRTKLTHGSIRYSAHYLGVAEISNVEGTEDCRREMNAAKGKAGQMSDVPHVMLEISVSGVNILDENEKVICLQPISHIQVVCQDELDLNCFAYIFKDDGDRHFSHVFCVLTAMIAKEIIVTLGEAFNLAYKIALQKETISI